MIRPADEHTPVIEIGQGDNRRAIEPEQVREARASADMLGRVLVFGGAIVIVALGVWNWIG